SLRRKSPNLIDSSLETGTDMLAKQRARVSRLLQNYRGPLYLASVEFQTWPRLKSILEIDCTAYMAMRQVKLDAPWIVFAESKPCEQLCRSEPEPVKPSGAFLNRLRCKVQIEISEGFAELSNDL